jgi:hypothetical protein
LTNDTATSTNGGTTSHGSAIAAGLSGRQWSASQAASRPPSASSANGAISGREPARLVSSRSIALRVGRCSQAICPCWRLARPSSGPSTITATPHAASQRSGIRPIRRPGVVWPRASVSSSVIPCAATISSPKMLNRPVSATAAAYPSHHRQRPSGHARSSRYEAITANIVSIAYDLAICA